MLFMWPNSQSYINSWLFLNKTFLFLAVEVDIKCELIDGGPARYLSTFSNLFIVAVHYTHINTCYVLLTIPM